MDLRALPKRQMVATGEAILRGLLKTPKTRGGLIAAVKGHGLSKNFVFGFLSEAERSGEVVKLKSREVITYQMATQFRVESPEPSVWPSWLDPRTLPQINGRRVFFGGRPAEQQQQEFPEDECD